MLEALYNLTILAETGIFAYGAGKLGLDILWEKTVEFICQYDLWDNPEVAAFMSVFSKENS